MTPYLRIWHHYWIYGPQLGAKGLAVLQRDVLFLPQLGHSLSFDNKLVQFHFKCLGFMWFKALSRALTIWVSIVPADQSLSFDITLYGTIYFSYNQEG